jgi:hypothetical protein
VTIVDQDGNRADELPEGASIEKLSALVEDEQ